MFTRLLLTPLAFAGAMLGATVGAFAQSGPGPAPAYAQQQAPDPEQAGPDGQPMGPNGMQQGPNGQAGHGMHHPAKWRIVLRSLDLSPDQKAQIKTVVRQFRASKQSSTPMTRQQMLAQIRGVLSPEQRAQFAEAMRHPMPGMNGPNGGGPQGYGPQGQQGPNGQEPSGQPDPGQGQNPNN